MGRSKAERELAQERREAAWTLYCRSVPQYQIAEQLGVSPQRVTRMIREAAGQAAAALPQSREELAAELVRRWDEAEGVIRGQIAEQQRSGRVVTTVVVRPDGSQVVERQHTAGVDPGLVRALSTHVDRRARQALNQAAIAEGAGGTSHLDAVRVFLTQPMTGPEFSAGKWGSMTAAEWNNQQETLPERGR